MAVVSWRDDGMGSWLRIWLLLVSAALASTRIREIVALCGLVLNLMGAERCRRIDSIFLFCPLKHFTFTVTKRG